MQERCAKIETSECSIGVRHDGTREALIAAGLAKPEQFPGEPGCGKTSTVFPRDGKKSWRSTTERRRIRVSRRGPSLYTVLVYWTADERAAYEARWQAKMAEYEAQEKEERRQRDAELMRKALAEGGGARGLVETTLKGGMYAIFRAFNITNDPAVPYGFDAETLRRVEEHCRELILLSRSDTLREKLAPVAQGDAGFQRFMNTSIGGAAKT